MGNLLDNARQIVLAGVSKRIHSETNVPVSQREHAVAKKKESELGAGQPRVVVRVETSQLPDDYQRVTIEADKTALKHALKAGDVIDGVELESTEHIRIRVK